MQLVPECYKTQETCVKTVNNYPFLFDSFPPFWYKTQEMCVKVFSENPFMLKYWYNTQGMCDKAVNTLLPTLKFIADWFLSKKKND